MSENSTFTKIKNPRRILFVISNTDLGGAQQHLLLLLKAFSQEMEVLCVYGDHGPVAHELKRIGVHHYRIPGLGRSGHLVESLKALSALRSIVKVFNPDIIHAHSSKAGLLARIVGAFSKKPVVYTVHGWGFKPGVPLFRRCAVWLSELLCVPLTRRLIAVSQYDYMLAARWLPGSKRRLSLIWNGISDVEKRRCHFSAQLPVVAMVARFREPKRQDLVIQAFVEGAIPAELWLIGDGPDLARAKELNVKLGELENIKFLGDRSDIEDLLAQTDVFVLISNYEGLPISILEAMRAGVPVVASRVGGIPEEVGEGVTGYLVDNSLPEIKEALGRLVLDPKLRNKMGSAGRARFLEHFQNSSMLEKTFLIYREILN